MTNLDLENSLNSAAGNRILCYAKCFAENQVRVYIASVIYHNQLFIKKHSKDVNLVIGSKRLYKNYINDFRFFTHFRHYKYLATIIKGTNDNLTYFLYDSTLASTVVSLFYFKCIHNNRLFIEKNELQSAIPLNNYRPSNLPYKIAVVINAWISSVVGFIVDIMAIFFDGIIAISTNMKNLYSKYNNNTLHIPILNMANNQIVQIKKMNNKVFKIGYAGVISQEKEGISDLIASMKLLKQFQIELHLMGLVRNEYMLKIYSYLKDEQIDQKVFYHGNLSQDNMINMLKSFDLLVLVRPDSIQARYGFSTKLGDYLSTGVPVLISTAGDGKIFIKDGINGFIVTDTSPMAVANKIKEIVTLEYKKMEDIGLKGYHTCNDKFYYKNYSKQLYHFIFS